MRSSSGGALQGRSKVRRHTGRGPRGLALVCTALAVLAAIASTAQAYTFGEPAVRAVGPEVRVFDWSTQKCADDDIPDQPTRAFRDSNGNVVMINSHYTVRRYLGATLATVSKVCGGIMFSGENRNPALYDDREWLASTYTHDGATVYGLIHSEHQGWADPPGYCIRAGESWADQSKCWYNALTLASSTNGGASFTHTAPPTHYVGGSPYRYIRGAGAIGAFQPSNIVRGKDGLFYVLVHVEGYGAQPTGACLWRTGDLGDPRSWRAWGGTAFDVQLRDPYVVNYPPQEGVCTPVSPLHIGTVSESLTWSTYLKKWVLVGSLDNADGVSGPGFYFFTSDDLINWSTAKLLMKAELPWTYECQDGPEQLRDPSLLDNDSTSRNFETIGQRPFLFFTRFNLQFGDNGSCYTNLDRDLIRIPVEFSVSPPPDPDPDPDPDPEPQPNPNPSPGAGGASSGSAPPKPIASVQVSAPPMGLFRVAGKPRARADGSLTLRVHAPAAGRFTLRAVGRRAAVRPATKQASTAGTLTITIRLSAAGKALLRKKRQARVRTTLTFTPVGGARQKSTSVLTLRRARTG